MAIITTDSKNYTDIAAAIRSKNGLETQYRPDEMAAAISAIESGGNSDWPTNEDLIFTGYCDTLFQYDHWTNFLNKFKNRIVVDATSVVSKMFYSCPSLVDLSGLNIRISASNNFSNQTSMFNSCENLEKLPHIEAPTIKDVNCTNCFDSCYKLKEIPDDFMILADDAQASSGQSMFYNCYSLRHISSKFLRYFRPKSYYNSIYYSGLAYCISLDELVDAPINTTSTLNSNMFNKVEYLCRLKDFIFETQEDGTPYASSNIYYQVFALRDYIGYVRDNWISTLTRYTDFTEATRVIDDESYQRLKDNPDYWTSDIAYSRYNHDSAVRTINSLPDLSTKPEDKYNNIIFKGENGSKTDGGAISTLTEAEIAVATAKGWTVMLQ